MNSAKQYPPSKPLKKIADAFEVSLDYLAGEGINAAFEKKLRQLQDIHKLEKIARISCSSLLIPW
jgi:hypothetical protein